MSGCATKAIEPILTARRFANRLLKWYDHHGRKQLPWQQDVSPYRVWLSEVMLQQTQVNTVLDYFQRFTARFPTVQSLAAAELDEVLHLWSGLGYYARARHLHQTAQRVVNDFNGEFPDNLAQMQSLPGIGRSTAGAILSLAKGQSQAILDGNVKRVLARSHCVAGYPEQSAVKRALWTLADYYTPQSRAGDFNQAMMDIGALICGRTPDCALCPLQPDCLAYRHNVIAEYPQKKIKKEKPVQQTRLLLLVKPNGKEVLLQQRPKQGIWGGLWSFPEIGSEPFKLKAPVIETWPTFRHTFTHFHLDITPVYLKINEQPELGPQSTQFVWYHIDKGATLGLSAAVKRLLIQLRSHQNEHNHFLQEA